MVAMVALKHDQDRPATKSEMMNKEKQQTKTVKNLRYVLLKNPENLSENQATQLDSLTKPIPSTPACMPAERGLLDSES